MLEVSSARANDHWSFAAIAGEMANGGYEAMLYDLLAFDLEYFNHRAAPSTRPGCRHKKGASLPVAEDWWFETLYRGYVFRSRDRPRRILQRLARFGCNRNLVRRLRDTREGPRRAASDRARSLRCILVRMGGRGTRPRNAVIGERIADVANIYGGTSRKAELVRSGRPYGYNLGNLQIARAASERATGININWPPDDAPEI